MLIKRLKVFGVIVLVPLVLNACALVAPKTEFAAQDLERYTSMSDDDIVKTGEVLLQKAEQENYALYSPSRFNDAKSAMAEIRALVSKKAEKNLVAQQILLIDKSITEAGKNKELVNTHLQDEMRLFHALHDRKADINFKKDYDSVVGDLTSYIRALEDGKIDKVNSSKKTVNKDLFALEVRAIKYNHLHDAEVALNEAKEKGGEKLAPQSYKEAKALYAQADKTIGEKPYDDTTVAKFGKDTVFAAKHALHVTLAVQDFEKQIKASIEQLVFSEEARLATIAKSLKQSDIRDRSLSEQAATLTAAVEQLASANSNADDLKKELDMTITKARDAEQQRVKLEQEHTALREQLEALKTEKSALEAKLQTTQVTNEAPVTETPASATPEPASNPAVEPVQEPATAPSVTN